MPHTPWNESGGQKTIYRRKFVTRQRFKAMLVNIVTVLIKLCNVLHWFYKYIVSYTKLLRGANM